MKTPNRQIKSNLIHVVFLIGTVLVAYHWLASRTPTKTIPYSQFLEHLGRQQIESITIDDEQIRGKLKNAISGQPSYFATRKVEDHELAQRLLQSGVQFEAVRKSVLLRDVVAWLSPLLFMLGFWWLLFGRLGKTTQGQFMTLGKARAKVYVERQIKTKFSDVAGVNEAKMELQEVVEFLKNPSKYNRLGGRVPKGLLLVGPPGTGKTLLARAVAGEAQVPFFLINGSEFVELFVGLGAARVRDLFDQARRQAPCIIFIDELDALGKARGISAISGGANDEKEQTLNQLLAELDGFDPSLGVVLLAATNRPEILDPALLRSGRFDRQIVIDKPDRLGRSEILKIHLKKIRISNQVNPEMLGGLTAGFSGADLENLVNEAALIATRRGAERVEPRDFTAGIERIVGGLERKNRILSSDEKKRIAYHEMGHATLSLAINHGETIHKVSIIPRGIGALGYTMRRPIEDRYLMSKKELEIKLAVLLGGRAAETIFFDDISTGAADDLDKTTELARSMVTRFGMSEKLGLLTYERESAPLLGGYVSAKRHEYSEDTARLIDQETASLVNGAFVTAGKVIKLHRAFIENTVQRLLETESLDEDELRNYWEKYQTKPQLTASFITAIQQL